MRELNMEAAEYIAYLMSKPGKSSGVRSGSVVIPFQVMLHLLWLFLTSMPAAAKFRVIFLDLTEFLFYFRYKDESMAGITLTQLFSDACQFRLLAKFY